VIITTLAAAGSIRSRRPFFFRGNALAAM